MDQVTESSAFDGRRPEVVTSISKVFGALAAGNMLAGFVMLFARLGAPSPIFSVADQFLIALFLFHGIVVGLLTNEFYGGRRWAYWIMRAFVIGFTNVLSARSGWSDAIDSEPVRRAYGIVPARDG